MPSTHSRPVSPEPVTPEEALNRLLFSPPVNLPSPAFLETSPTSNDPGYQSTEVLVGEFNRILDLEVHSIRNDFSDNHTVSTSTTSRSNKSYKANQRRKKARQAKAKAKAKNKSSKKTVKPKRTTSSEEIITQPPPAPPVRILTRSPQVKTQNTSSKSPSMSSRTQSVWMLEKGHKTQYPSSSCSPVRGIAF